MLHRQILSPADLNAFQESEAFQKLISFIDTLNDSVRGKKNSSIQECNSSQFPLINWCCELISEAEAAIARFPPADRQAEVNRFGSPAFRDWMHHLQSSVLPKKCAELQGDAVVIEEAQFYFANALGSSERIDYGTGHELHFLVFLLCIKELQLGRIGSNESNEATEQESLVFFNQLLVLKVFHAYVQLMAHLQRLYWLEPAGSHGVWGLDDYHFLPFLFGAAQLIGNTQVRPKSVNAPEMVEWCAREYLYFEMVDRILKVKSAIDEGRDVVAVEEPKSSSLRWLSPVLDDIAAVKTWDKVNSGLIKMYRVEVLGKLPIMQHCLFGTRVLSFKGAGKEESQATGAHYKHSQRGDCCGNPLPSIYSASGKMKVKQPGLPFD